MLRLDVKTYSLLVWLNRSSAPVCSAWEFSSPRDGLMLVQTGPTGYAPAALDLWLLLKFCLLLFPPRFEDRLSTMPGVVGSECYGSAVGEKMAEAVSEDTDPIRHAM